MSAYFMNFHVFGEVADYLLLKEPQRRLLVDLSIDTGGQGDEGPRRHPNRTTFTIYDEDMIERFLDSVAIGDLTEATGTFSQSNYVPHKTSYIDTTFVMSGFRKLNRELYALKYRGYAIEPPQDAMVH